MKFPSPAVVVLALASAPQAQAAPAPAPPPATAQELVVTAEHPPAQVLIDRKVFAVSGDLQATSGSAADLLNTVPSVSVDADGNVSVRGDSNVTVLLDGKPSAQFSGAALGASLLQFPANQVDRVEVMADPPAQYKSEGSGGVINIITKKTRAQGSSGTVQLSGGDHGRAVFGLDGGYNAGKLKLSGGIGLRRDVRERLTLSNRTEKDPVSGLQVQSAQNIDEHFNRLQPQVKGSIDYALNSRQSVGASFNRRDLGGHRYFDQSNASGPPGGAPTSLSNRHSDGHEWNMGSGASVRFDQKLWRPDETLSLDLQRSITQEREHYFYTNSFALPAGPLAYDDLNLSLDLIKTEFSADYDLPLAGDREVKLGYDLETDRNRFDNLADAVDAAGGRTVDPNATNHFRYRQTVNAGYAQYQAPLGSWRLQAGARLEATRVAFLQVTGNIPGGRDDFGVYPSLHLDRSLSDAVKIGGSITRRITRPDPEALNPFSDHQDTHNLRAGNANLAPEDTWSYELSYSYSTAALTYGATAYYRLDRNSVTDVVRPVSADVVLATKANLPLIRSGGLDVNANGKLGRKLSYNLSGDLFYSQINAAAVGGNALASTTGVNLKASLDWRPTAVDTAQISATRTDKVLTPQGYVSAINLVNLGYRRQLRPNLALVATLSDLFNAQKVHRVVDTPLLHDDYVRHQLGRVAYFGFVYTFGAQAKAKPAGFQYD